MQSKCSGMRYPSFLLFSFSRVQAGRAVAEGGQARHLSTLSRHFVICSNNGSHPRPLTQRTYKAGTAQPQHSEAGR